MRVVLIFLLARRTKYVQSCRFSLMAALDPTRVLHRNRVVRASDGQLSTYSLQLSPLESSGQTFRKPWFRTVGSPRQARPERIDMGSSLN